VAARNAEQAALLFQRLRTVPPFRPEVWTDTPRGQWYAVNLQRALWAIEHDLTACAYVKGQRLEWDSHSYYLHHQARSSNLFFPLIARFFDELKRRSNSHGRLIDTTFVYASSEVGRHPRVNSSKGKDHFPEAPVFMAGPGIAPGRVFGQSGRQTLRAAASPPARTISRSRSTTSARRSCSSRAFLPASTGTTAPPCRSCCADEPRPFDLRLVLVRVWRANPTAAGGSGGDLGSWPGGEPSPLV
jgi:hypothetical protein